MAKAPKTDETMIEVEQFATIMKISPDEARTLARKHILPKINNGQFPLVVAIQRYVEHLRNPELSLADCALACQISQQWIMKLTQEGFIQKTANSKLRPMDVLLGYVKWLRDESRRTNKSTSEVRVKEARANEIEMRIAMKQRDLIPVEDALNAMSDLCGVTRQVIDGLPARLTRDMDLRRKWEVNVTEALETISNRAAELGKTVRSGVDASETVEEETT